MKADVTTLDSASAGSVDLDDAIFGLPARADILHRVVTWQLAKRRSGNHRIKLRGEIRATGAKVYRQKGTGSARHGSKRANIYRGGAKAFGPVVRDHGYSLPKKVRILGLKTALSAKLAAGQLVVLDEAKLSDPKTKVLKDKFAKLGWTSALIIDGNEIDDNFVMASRNLGTVDVLPSQGANVYDILRRDTLVITKAGLKDIEERLK